MGTKPGLEEVGLVLRRRPEAVAFFVSGPDGE
jgi:hypothetical protein